ncbi:hypothetical protein OSB04_014882 [Centaurea solstitialis]|uniref:Uncharacterized protein n=1 Tax=Centaurea solstitialis TaxID=347529 RepID=A0AA38W6V7_9ASTR|nr:hypothetical protein OSB04_014882 [Centaurea solstitialis]
MAATIANQDKISLKVLFQKGHYKVIFAEADNNFVDTLFSIVTLPLGTIVRILGKSPDQRLNPLVSLQNLHKSLVELPESYLSSEEGKFMMLNPRTKIHECCTNLKLQIDDTEPTKYIICENEGCNKKSLAYFSTCSLARCLYCRKAMTREIKYTEMFDPTLPRRNERGVLVPDPETFIVTDDLFVVPNTLDAGLRLLCDRGFTDASHLEEKTIDIGREQFSFELSSSLICLNIIFVFQMLILLRAALVLKYPLTYLVFNIIHPIGTPVRSLTCNEEDRSLKTMTLKLTLQKSTSKFLFAETGEDFVDFLFGFLEIPLGTLIVESMNDKTYLESLENLYDSICGMDFDRCIRSRWNRIKRMLTEPKLVWKYVSVNQISPLDSSEVSSEINYQYGVLGTSGTMFRSSNVSDCSKYNLRFKDPRVEGKFLKKATKFMITDDLTVTPFSTIFAIAIMNESKVPLKDLEHHVVTIGIEEGLKICNASLKSRSTLSDVLLGPIIEKKKRDAEEFQSLSKKHGGPNMEQITGLKRKK